MSYLLGIDIGTSGTKVIAIDEDGRLVASASREYPLLTPKPLWAEQHPADWWRAVSECCREITSKIDASEIAGIGLSGQMHGLVALDANGEVLRPAILWCDGRTQEQCDYITQKVGKDVLVEETCNPVLTGFTAPKIIWMRDHEPHLYERAQMFLLPKDYIRFRLSGEFATEVSDASGTSLLNVPKRQWSNRVLDALQISKDKLPRVYESCEVSATVSRAGSEATGLREGTPVVGGGGDQAAGAVGNGIVQSGVISVATGTSGVVFAFADTPSVDPQLRVHTFCHAVPNKWHVMGVMLSAGGSLRWFRDTLGRPESRVAELMDVDPYELIAREVATVQAGSEGLLFLPYLSGRAHAASRSAGAWRVGRPDVAPYQSAHGARRDGRRRFWIKRQPGNLARPGRLDWQRARQRRRRAQRCVATNPGRYFRFSAFDNWRGRRPGIGRGASGGSWRRRLQFGRRSVFARRQSRRQHARYPRPCRILCAPIRDLSRPLSGFERFVRRFRKQSLS